MSSGIPTCTGNTSNQSAASSATSNGGGKLTSEIFVPRREAPKANPLEGSAADQVHSMMVQHQRKAEYSARSLFSFLMVALVVTIICVDVKRRSDESTMHRRSADPYYFLDNVPGQSRYIPVFSRKFAGE